tara:strand:- start:160 stop:480 length:321 start_codon:yes stop_codon:yes gene_type:complete
MNIKQIKADAKTLKQHHKELKALHVKLSNEASIFQSRYRISGDEEQAEIGELYEKACQQIKLICDMTSPGQKLGSIVQQRVKRLPGLWRRMFPKKQKAFRPARSSL